MLNLLTLTHILMLTGTLLLSLVLGVGMARGLLEILLRKPQQQRDE